jgi:hypothetical protein
MPYDIIGLYYDIIYDIFQCPRLKGRVSAGLSAGL